MNELRRPMDSQQSSFDILTLFMIVEYSYIGTSGKKSNPQTWIILSFAINRFSLLIAKQQLNDSVYLVACRPSYIYSLVCLICERFSLMTITRSPSPKSVALLSGLAVAFFLFQISENTLHIIKCMKTTKLVGRIVFGCRPKS